MLWLLCCLLLVSACSSQPAARPHAAAGTPGASARSTPAKTKAPALSPAQADALASGLRSGSAKAVSEFVAVPAGKEVPATFVAEMAALKGLRIDPATSRDNGDGTGTARAALTTAAGDVSTWTVLLVRGGAGGWKVTATAPAGSTP